MVIEIGVPTRYWDTLVEVPYPLWKNPPEWMLNTTNNGLLRCPVTRNTMQKTIVISHNTDTEVKFVDGEFDVKLSENEGTEVRFHREHEFSGLTHDHVSVKIAPPMTLLCETVVQFTPPFLHEVPSIGTPMYGMVNVPGAMRCAVNCLYHTESYYVHELPKGSPLCYLTFPNIESKVEVEMIKYDGDQHVGDTKDYHL